MISDIFIYSKTRTIDKGWTDYQWIYRPNYFGEQLLKVVDALKTLFSTSANKEFIKCEGSRNIYFVTFLEGCALLRVRESSVQDIGGREIYSIEGFSASKNDIRYFWWNLPRLINSLLANTTVYRDETDGKLRKKDLPSEMKLEPSQIEQHLFSVPSLFMTDYRLANSPFSFVLGTRTQQFYPYEFSRYYSIEEKDSQSVGVSEDSYECTPAVALELTEQPYQLNITEDEDDDDTYDLYAEFYDKGTTCYLILSALNKANIAIAKSENLMFNDKGISMKRINAAKYIMLDKLAKQSSK